MAVRICRTLEQPVHADATDEDWDMYHLIYNNANDLLWKHAPSVMMGDNSKLKLLMTEWARDCDKVWNGTAFVEIDEMEQIVVYYSNLLTKFNKIGSDPFFDALTHFFAFF